MEYEEFKHMLLKKIQEKMGSTIELKYEKFRKVNGIEVEALTLSGGGKLTPAAHVKDLYELYQQQGDEGGFEACIEMIEQLYLREATNQAVMSAGTSDLFVNADTFPAGRIFRPWKELKEEVKAEIMPVLIHKQWNEALLRDIPHREFLDLAVILQVKVFETPDGSATVRVGRDIVKLWDVDEKELWDTAFRNLRNETFVIQDFREMASGILGMLSIEDKDALPEYCTSEEEPLEKENGLGPEEDDSGDTLIEEGLGFQYVMTNSSKYCGAVGMLRTELLQEFAEKVGYSLFILPCSLHELILIPDKGILSVEMLRETVDSVNQEEVEVKDRLSDSVYYFRKDIGRIEIF